jgi:hypothetical protein
MTEITHIGELKHDPQNARMRTVRGLSMIEQSLNRNGAGRSILIDEDDTILAGNGVIDAAAAAGIEKVRVIEAEGDEIIAVRRSNLTGDQKTEMALFDNRTAELATWDTSVLADLREDHDLGIMWFDDELDRVITGTSDESGGDTDGGLPDEPDEVAREVERVTASLADRFLVPPFSVLDARQGYWQARKRAWLELGIQSELGRGENTLGLSEGVNERHGPSTGPYRKSSASPGGSLRDATTLGADGKTQRGDGVGRPVGDARPPSGRLTFATGRERTDEVSRQIAATQRESGSRLTWVAGDRSEAEMDETSRKNLAGGRGRDGMHARPPHGSSVTQNPDGTLNYQPSNNGEGASGTSIFDPVLSELSYLWFSPPGGMVLDPFAGGSVRGIVAAKTGRRYVGIDLSAPQVAANEQQAHDLLADEDSPVWHVGDSRDLKEIMGDEKADLVFSCPPYADLEVYSDDPRDLSTMAYDDFLVAYREIIAASVEALHDDRFACFVVGDIRDRKGLYRNFVSHTIAAFVDAGAALYNDAILVTAVGSLPIRAGRQFSSGRKLGKTHQNVLCFVKGDPKRATEACGEVVVDPDLFPLDEGTEGQYDDTADAPVS